MPATPAPQQTIAFPGQATAKARGFSRVGRRVAGLGQRVQAPGPTLNPEVQDKRQVGAFGGIPGPLNGAIRL